MARTANETSPLLSHGTREAQSPRPLQRLGTHLKAEIDPQHADLLLLLCYTITGLLDSSAVFIWGSFVSMQTGNTVYLGLGISGLDESGRSQRWLKSLISIASFCLGSFLFALLHHSRVVLRSPRQRGALFFSFLLQMACVAVAATIVTLEKQSKSDPLSWKIAVPLALVAFQSSGQAVTSRVVGYSSLTSVVLTSIYCDLFSYPALALTTTSAGGGKKGDEWRRLGAVLALFGGILVGGLWAKSEVGLKGALWTAVVLKGGIAGAWLVCSGEGDDEDVVYPA
ncbi:hypothetical protein BJX68DRAFT_278084 [Aspergillus pseudodeflectus]|uniref:DUF1275 domain protein n=1 Tax=Aspergillus pseudodeflectus TaxID=176178 RepID=A0ABR4JT76_9EURO